MNKQPWGVARGWARSHKRIETEPAAGAGLKVLLLLLQGQNRGENATHDRDAQFYRMARLDGSAVGLYQRWRSLPG